MTVNGITTASVLAAVLLLVYTTSAEKERYSNSWAVKIVGGAEKADEIARKHGFVNFGQVGNIRDVYHFMMEDPAQRSAFKLSKPAYKLTIMDSQPDMAAELQTDEEIEFAEQQKLLQIVKLGYEAPTDPGWRNQWAMENTGQTFGPSGLDLNVEPVWLQGITGDGISVAFVDDGLERSHPDLSPNYDPLASWDFVNEDNDPTPEVNFEEPNTHGTNCAGEVGMARDNGHCGVGMAYKSKIGGLKVDFSMATDLIFARALGHNDNHVQVYSNSWGPIDFGFTVSGPGLLTELVLSNGISEGRDGKGSVFVFASGNGGRNFDSCAASGYVNSIYTIAIGSADQDGAQADYDEQCSGKMAVTFGYNSDTFSENPYNQIYTTTLNGQCTDDFTGTSASTPLASGAIALALQANPDLTWRDVQYLIAYTSNSDILRDGEWATNGAGLKVSHKFGFGVIDAEAMVTRAKRWTSVPDQLQYSLSPFVSDSTAAFNDPTTIPFTVTASSGIQYLEHVVVKMSLSVGGFDKGYDYGDLYLYLYFGITGAAEKEAVDFDFEFDGSQVGELTLADFLEDPHARRGDIMIELTSPQGTTSTLLPYRRYDFVNENGYENWPFMSVHHWGENPVGTWNLKVSFKSFTGYVTVDGVSVTLYGTATTPSSVSSIPSSCDSACAGKCSGPGQENCDICKNYRVAQTLECVDQCPENTLQYKSYCLNDPASTPTSINPVPTSTSINSVPTTTSINPVPTTTSIVVATSSDSPVPITTSVLPTTTTIIDSTTVIDSPTPTTDIVNPAPTSTNANPAPSTDNIEPVSSTNGIDQVTTTVIQSTDNNQPSTTAVHTTDSVTPTPPPSMFDPTQDFPSLGINTQPAIILLVLALLFSVLL